MKINQVAERADMTSKNIRFYEDQGLIKPKRDPQNGYREYTLEDVKQLERIKLLRQLGISCENIRMLQSGELDFDTCMSEHMETLGRERENLDHMAVLCGMLSDEVDDVSDIDASAYLDRMKELEKGGVRFMNVRMSDVRKRKTGAILSAIAVMVIAALMIAGVLLANSVDPAPWVVIAVFGIIFVGITGSVAVALVGRRCDVKKGEIDEASKY